MTGRAGLRDVWVDIVIAAKVGPSCKLLLLILAHRMNSRGEVDNLSRQDMAALLDVHEQRIAERIGEAKRAGLLNQVGRSGGKAGRTARYVAVLPDGWRTAHRYPTVRSGTEDRYANIGTRKRGQNGPDVPVSGTPYARALTNATEQPIITRGDSPHSDSSKDGSDEDVARPSVLAADSTEAGWNLTLTYAPLGKTPRVVEVTRRAA